MFVSLMSEPAAVVLLALAALASLLITIVAQVCVHWQLRRASGGGHHAPPISVLKPLKGIDDHLEENLASFAGQDYPGEFELVFGATDSADPAMEVVGRLQRRFPNLAIKTVWGRPRPGVNPKVANLRSLTEAASHELILVSDSNVRVEPSYLRDIVANMKEPDVGLVTNVLCGSGEESFGAMLENLHLNSFVVAGVCGATVLAGHTCVIGKSMLMRRTQLEQLGGWSLVADVLGEDYLLGRVYERAGYRVVLSSHVVRTINTGWGVRRFASRHLRWSQMRRWIAPSAYALEPMLNPIPWSLALLAVGASREGATTWIPLALLAILAKLSSDVLVFRRLRGQWPTAVAVSCIPIKDVLVLLLWGIGWVWRRVDWRGNAFLIGRGSSIRPVHTSDSALEPWEHAEVCAPGEPTGLS